MLHQRPAERWVKLRVVFSSKVDFVASAPLQDLGNSLSTYAAQNKGAGDDARVRKGFLATAKMVVALASAVGAAAFAFAPDLVALFVDPGAADVVAAGAGYLRVSSPAYALLGFVVMFYGFFRGIGCLRVSILLTVASQGLRVLLAYALAPSLGFSGVCWAVVAGWLLSDLLGFWMYARVAAAKPPARLAPGR